MGSNPTIEACANRLSSEPQPSGLLPSLTIASCAADRVVQRNGVHQFLLQHDFAQRPVGGKGLLGEDRRLVKRIACFPNLLCLTFYLKSNLFFNDVADNSARMQVKAGLIGIYVSIFPDFQSIYSLSTANFCRMEWLPIKWACALGRLPGIRSQQ
jgi:hypothetical protein